MTNNIPWGMELQIDIADCPRRYVTDPDYIRDFSKDLVESIDMVAFGEPQVIHFGNEHLEGWTLVQLIETSCITAHFNDETGDAYINVFSCKDFDPVVAINVIKTWFMPTYIRFAFTARDAQKEIEQTCQLRTLKSYIEN